MTVLSQFMAAINHGQRWTICKYMEQQMWRPEWADGGRGQMRLRLVVLSQRVRMAAIRPRPSSLFSSSSPIRQDGQSALTSPVHAIWDG